MNSAHVNFHYHYSFRGFCIILPRLILIVLWLVRHYFHFVPTDTNTLISQLVAFYSIRLSVNIATNLVTPIVQRFRSDPFRFHRSSRNLTINTCT